MSFAAGAFSGGFRGGNPGDRRAGTYGGNKASSSAANQQQQQQQCDAGAGAGSSGAGPGDATAPLRGGGPGNSLNFIGSIMQQTTSGGGDGLAPSMDPGGPAGTGSAGGGAKGASSSAVELLRAITEQG